MNARCLVALTILLLVFGQSALGSTLMEPFSMQMKRAEMIFIGTLVEKQYAANEVSIGCVTDFTFDVDKLIEGEPNIDKDTVIFCIPGGECNDSVTGEPIIHDNTMGDEYAHLEVGEQLILLMQYNKHIAKWMPRRDGFYPVQIWHVKKKKVDGKEELLVYFWSNFKDDRLKHHFLGIPLALFLEFVEASREHPDEIDPVSNIIAEAIMDGFSRQIRPDTPEAERIRQSVIDSMKRVLEALNTAEPEEEKKQ